MGVPTPPLPSWVPGGGPNLNGLTEAGRAASISIRDLEKPRCTTLTMDAPAGTRKVTLLALGAAPAGSVIEIVAKHAELRVVGPCERLHAYDLGPYSVVTLSPEMPPFQHDHRAGEAVIIHSHHGS